MVLFEKLDIEADMLAVGKYKSAVEPYTRDSMSDAQREAIDAILDDLYEQQVQMIADGRSEIDVEMAVNLIDQGPFTAEEASEVKLVDALQYYDESGDIVSRTFKPDAHACKKFMQAR